MKKYIIILIAILFLAGCVSVLAYLEFGNLGNTGNGFNTVATSTPVGGEVACIEEAIRCPDGSLVQRSGPNCDFEKCPTVPTDNPVVCTMDAKQCPDGSYVGRTGPNCEFEVCPVVTPNLVGGIEKQIGFVKNIYQKDGKYYLDIDYIQWLSNFPVQNCSNIGLSAPNGYCIINDNPLIRTLEIDSSASVKTTIQITSEGKLIGGTEGGMKTTDLSLLLKSFNDPSNIVENNRVISLFNITIDSYGKIVELSEQYRP